MAAARKHLSLPAIEPQPLAWPRWRQLGLQGKGRRLASLAVRARGGQRRAVVRDAAFRALANVTPSFAVDADGARIHVDTGDGEISRLVFVFGLYDKPLMTTVVSALDQLGIPDALRNRMLLDVGANIGTTTLTATACFGAAGGFAFEPDPTNFRALTVNLAANDLLGTVRAFELALSDRESMVELERSASSAGDHRVRVGAPPPADAFKESEREVIEVPARRLDDLVASGAVELDRVAIAWLDVQGHEAQVLGGAASLREAAIPLVVEYWPYGLRAAGGLERFHELAAAYPAFVDLGGPRGRPSGEIRPVDAIESLAAAHSGPDDHTDLLLLPPRLTV